MLLEALRNITVENYSAVIFRKSLKQIERSGGLWDTAMEIYPKIGAEAVKGNLLFRFKKYKSYISFNYLDRDEDVYEWDGTQVPLVCFDELIHFSEEQFFYMLGRNRTTCGMKPYVRATTNPCADCWVRDFISWYIDEDGQIPEDRSGVIRYFIRDAGQVHWFSSLKESLKQFPDHHAKSFTFISSNVYDNKILLEKNPEYIGNLQMQSASDVQRLLHGNWNSTIAEGDYFNKNDFDIVDKAPEMVKMVRAWDIAHTKPHEKNKNPDWTVGLLGGICAKGVFYILHIARFRDSSAKVKERIKGIAAIDGTDIQIEIPKDPSAGVAYADLLIKELAGYAVTATAVTHDKETRALVPSAQAGIRNIKLIRADWNAPFLNELQAFPTKYGKKDQVDALSDCIKALSVDNKSLLIEVVPRPLCIGI